MGQLRLTCTFYAECAQPEGCGIAAFGGDEYIVSVTGPASVYPLLHDEEQDPPFLLTGIYGYSGHLLLVPRFFTAFRMTVPAGKGPQATEEHRGLDDRNQMSDSATSLALSPSRSF